MLFAAKELVQCSAGQRGVFNKPDVNNQNEFSKE